MKKWIPMPSEEKLRAQLGAYYKSLATIDTLSEKEQEKLYKDIDKTVARLRDEAEKAKEKARFLSASQDELEARAKDTANSLKKGFIIRRAPANGTIDYREAKTDHFARGMNGYKLFIVFFVGSFVGVVVETLWCIVSNGYIESRQGLVWGPFSPIYGVGAAVLAICLYRFRNRSSIYSFIGGFLTGSVVEYICSWLQEMLFGSTSWDYSHMPLNINGRVCLVYSIFWGFLGVFWIKSIYPRLSVWILKIPNRIGKILVWILLVFMVLNCIVSALAVYRWSEREQGIAQPSNAIEAFMDRHFPNDRMWSIYANMDFKFDQ